MIVPGRVAFGRNIITRLLSADKQIQPCGIDLTLKRVMTWSSPGAIDFTNAHRKASQTVEIPFQRLSKSRGATSGTSESNAQGIETDYIDIACGSCLVEFNECINMPLDPMGQIFVRSSLFRSGALVYAGVMDSGYQGAIEAVLQVVNPHGLRLYRDAKMAQIVFHAMSEPVEGYNGVYQGRAHV